MIELAAKHCCASELSRSTIVLGDVVDVLPDLKHSFDLILIDIYKGKVPEPRLYTRELIEAISACTLPSGQILLNAFQNTGLIDAFCRQLDHLNSWRFCTNHLASFATWPPLPLSDDESPPITS